MAWVSVAPQVSKGFQSPDPVFIPGLFTFTLNDLPQNQNVCLKFWLKLMNRNMTCLFFLFVPQFLVRHRRTCGCRRNGTTASGSAGTHRRRPPWATGSSTSPCLVTKRAQTLRLRCLNRFKRVITSVFRMKGDASCVLIQGRRSETTPRRVSRVRQQLFPPPVTYFN